jgi:transcription elongation factor Elf1
MTDEFYCHGCGKHKPAQMLAKQKKHMRFCKTCNERMSERAKQSPEDRVGTYSDGSPILRRHVDEHRRKKAQQSYLTGRAFSHLR